MLVLCSVVALNSAGRSPHADDIEQLIRSGGFERYSNNILEDASLDVPELVRKYNYPLEVHNVVTEDGYILGVHRIPHGRDRNNAPSAHKPIVFLMHGLLSSSADYIIMGPGSSFAYILAEEGYDVWLGNARGNYYSRSHTNLNPDGILDNRFWDFSWDEIGNMDLPAMIDYVLKATGKDRLHYVGHSQGSTAFFVMGSLRPDYNSKITSMHAFAPVAYMANTRNFVLRYIAQYANDVDKIATLIGLGEFMPNNDFTTWIAQQLCSDDATLQPLCSNMLFLIGGFNKDQHNATMMPVQMGHSPAGAAVKQFLHYGQSINDRGFRRYDFGTVRNLIIYRRFNPPSYELSKVTAPVFMHYSQSDPLAHVNDVYRLVDDLGGPVELCRIPDSRFSHLDFVWGIDAKTLLYDTVMNHMKSMDEHYTG